MQEKSINVALCKVTAPPIKQLPDLKCACCGKSLKQQAGENTVLLYAIVECQGEQYRICRDCEKVVKWVCEKKKEAKQCNFQQESTKQYT